MQPRHPEIRVKLIGEEANAFWVLGIVRRKLEQAGVDPEEIEKFTAQATARDYDVLLRCVSEWVEVE